MEQIGSPESKELQAKINASDPEIQQYIVALKAENAKLHKRIIKLEVQNLSADNRAFALEQHLKEQQHVQSPSLAEVKSLDNLADKLANSLGNKIL